MRILTGRAESENVVKGSRFLSEVIPVSSQAEARDTLKAQKEKYADATHVVHAFISGLGAEVMGMSDDGEPAGTAGRPVLDVLKGRGVTNILLTVTRWFGGTLLGTGGLVKAYGDGARAVLDAAEAAGLFEEYVEKCVFSFSADYAQYEKLKRLLGAFTVSEMSEQFGAAVDVSGKIPAADAEKLKAAVFDATNGKVSVTII